MSNEGKGIEAYSDREIAIHATSKENTAIYAYSDKGAGINAHSDASTGVSATSEKGIAIHAVSKEDRAVLAHSDKGIGIDAYSKESAGIVASSDQFIAIRAIAKKGTAVYAQSDEGTGIDAHTIGSPAVLARSEKGIGVHSIGKPYAGYFEGIVVVTGDVELRNADCAEDFEVSGAEQVEPGTVMALNNEGRLEQSMQPYDKRVAGVVSGAGDLKPGIVLGRQPGHLDRVPLALVGRVNCKIDASYGQVEVGDLLTTSPTRGHAMKANDPVKAFGAVIGKALDTLKEGQGLIQILVSLQ
jgi:hypothetical protein